MDHAAVVAGLVGGKLIFFLQHQELGFGIPLSDFQGGSQPNDSSADNSEVKLFRHQCSSLTQSFLAVNLTQSSRLRIHTPQWGLTIDHRSWQI